jgi:hypothetical protein
MSATKWGYRISTFLILGMILLLAQREADAVPSFARQTGLACSLCHKAFPELTTFGRTFKAGGYTLSQLKKIKATGEAVAPLELNEVLPLSLMLMTSYTRTDETLPDAQNNDVEFPQQLSVFLAGEMTPHIGNFIQVTYSQDADHFSIDNSDIRYASNTKLGGKDLVYGVTLNNNPTVEDLWNDLPAWSFPFATASDDFPHPAAAPLLDGELAQDVLGIGAYGLWYDRWYGVFSVYRSAHIGSTFPTKGDENTIQDVAPYWRLAWQKSWGNNFLELGTVGFYASLYPEGVSGDTDDYLDAGVDFQYSRDIGENLILAHGRYIYEDQDLEATYAGTGLDSDHYLHSAQLDLNYYLDGRFVFTLAGFLVDGDKNELVYQRPEPTADREEMLSGSANGKPDSSGIIGQVSYYPWQNFRLSLQYTAYIEFNGKSDNYNGLGRDASDNNTLFLLAWFMW